MTKKRIFEIVLVLIFAGAATYWAYQKKMQPQPITETEVQLDGPAERDYTYESERGGFSVLVPRGWRVAERTDERTFEVVVFPDIYGDRIPESFSTRTHVSVFPFGTGSGGELPWVSATSSLVNVNDASKATAFVTRTGEPWGWTLSFTEIPDTASWRTWGLVYGSLDMIQDEPVCITTKQLVRDMRECDPFAGDRVQRGGRINRVDEAKLLRVLRSVDVH